MRIASTLGVLLLCAAPVVLAQPGHDSARATGVQPVIDGRVFQRLDANGDGRLTRDEARIDPAVAAAFDRIDANGDGIISREEARRFDEKRDRPDADAAAGPGRDPTKDGNPR